MTRVLRAAALAVLLLAAVACGSKGHLSAAASSAAANPSASAALAKAEADGHRAANRCAVALGGTAAPGASALAEPAVLHRLATHGGQETCLAAAVPKASRREAAKSCLARAMSVFLLHPGALAGSSDKSARRRHDAENAALDCLQTAAGA